MILIDGQPKTDKKIEPQQNIDAEIKLLGGFTGTPNRQQDASPYLKQYLPPEPKQYSQSEVIKASFESENNIVSSIASKINGEEFDNLDDPNFDPVDFIEENILNTENGEHWEKFLNVKNSNDGYKLINKIKRENENREIIYNSGVSGFLWGMTAGVLDPTNIIPIGGGVYKAVKQGKFIKGALSTATIGGLSASLSEAGLQASQETRTLEESGVNIAGGSVLGGILGGAGALLSKRKFNNVVKKLNEDTDINYKRKVEVDDLGNVKPSQDFVKMSQNETDFENISKTIAKENPDIVIKDIEKGDMRLADVVKEIDNDNSFFSQVRECALIWGVK